MYDDEANDLIVSKYNKDGRFYSMTSNICYRYTSITLPLL